MPSRNPINSNIFDLVTTSIVAPGAGNEFTYAVPVNSRIEIIYIGFQLVTSVAVANRYLSILCTDPAQPQVMGATAIAQPASQTWWHFFVAGLPQEVNLSAVNHVITPLSPNLILEPGDTLDTLTHNIDVADTLISITTRFRQWVIA